jgi:hypothetical protein
VREQKQQEIMRCRMRNRLRMNGGEKQEVRMRKRMRNRMNGERNRKLE